MASRSSELKGDGQEEEGEKNEKRKKENYNKRFKGLVHRSRQHKNIPLKTKKKNFFKGEIGDILFHHRELFDSSISKKFHDTSEQSFRGFNDS
ncbi:hypothetical protein BT93_C1654 [Corymbia citriodora subsp. variegata]|nr:hypothetical protein BT93_C1654 [Corymbia citriodora subsp. variegata]